MAISLLTFLNEGSPALPFLSEGWLKSSKNEPESVKQPLEIVVSRPYRDSDVVVKVVLTWNEKPLEPREGEAELEESGVVTKSATCIFDADNSVSERIIQVPCVPVSYQVFTYYPACDPDKPPSGSPSGEKSEDKGSMNTAQSVKSTSEAHTVKFSDIVAVDEEAKEDTEDDTWTCRVCTLINVAGDDECVACGTSNTTSQVEVGAEGENTGLLEPRPGRAEEAGDAGWWCAACTFINPISFTTCEVCGTMRDDAQAPVADSNGWSPRSTGENNSFDEEDSVSISDEGLFPIQATNLTATKPKLQTRSTVGQDVVTITLRSKKQSNERRFLCDSLVPWLVQQLDVATRKIRPSSPRVTLAHPQPYHVRCLCGR